MSQLAPGTIFAKDYRVIRPLAEGGMGAVYVAEQLSTGKERALKVLLPRVVDDPRNRESFALEARVGSKVESDHVVEVVGAGVDEASGSPWLAMELLKGESLWERVTRRGPLARDEAATLFDQLGDALSKAHRAGVVHRDLKPENLFVADARIKGVPFVLKVLDFGIARLIAHDRTAATSTRAIGSPLWLAPEQTQTGAKLRPSTDVWAVGLLAFWSLTGRPFWLAANAEEFNLTALLMEVAVHAIPAASERAAALGVGASLPEGFDAWFSRCVVRDPDARFADAGGAIPALVSLLSAPPREVAPTATATATATGARTEAFSGVVRAAPTEAVPAFTARGGASTDPVAMGRGAPRAHPSPEAPSDRAGYVVPLVLGILTVGALGVWAMQRRPQAVAASDTVAVAPPAPVEPAAPAAQAEPSPSDRISARHLLVMYQGSARAPITVTRSRDEARARAEEARRLALAGRNFAALVREFSDEPGAGQRGGDLGRFGRGMMVPAFERAAFALAPDEISPVIETEFGFHVIQRTDAPRPSSAGDPVEAVVREPTSPDPRGGRFTLADATAGLEGSGPLVATIVTSMGTFRCTLLDIVAPLAVANFTGLARGLREFWDPVAGRWARRPFYDGSIFHRVIPDFMIQGGDLLRSGVGGTGYEFADENTRPHDAAGLLCMANHGPNTNGGQFFITESAKPHLDGSYSIFGRCDPTDLVGRIARVGRDASDRPQRPVFIERVTVTREP
ncbi:MAG: peptidylprolyl isomerase [Polyangiales bacterium]